MRLGRGERERDGDGDADGDIWGGRESRRLPSDGGALRLVHPQQLELAQYLSAPRGSLIFLHPHVLMIYLACDDVICSERC